MSPDEMQLRLEGGKGAEAQVAAMKHMITVFVESTLGLRTWIATGGLTMKCGNVLELDGRVREG